MTTYDCPTGYYCEACETRCCDCVADRLRREGAEAERRAVLDLVRWCIDVCERAAGYGERERAIRKDELQDVILLIKAGSHLKWHGCEHLRGESEGG